MVIFCQHHTDLLPVGPGRSVSKHRFTDTVYGSSCRIDTDRRFHALDDEIADHRSMAALTLLQKHIHQRDLAELVDRLAPILLAGYLSSSQVISLVHYIVQARETVDAEAFVRELAQRVPQHGDALMTIAQQLEQKGIEKGIQLGEQRGIEKGRSEGEREATLKIARTMLHNGIDRNTVMKMTGLTEDDLAQIRH